MFHSLGGAGLLVAVLVVVRGFGLGEAEPIVHDRLPVLVHAHRLGRTDACMRHAGRREML